MKSKQMRISDVHYKVLGQLSDEFGISRTEILGNAICLIKTIMDNKATAIKMTCGDEEKELLLTLLIGRTNES